MEPRLILDVFVGHLLEPMSPKLYRHNIRQRAFEPVKRDLWKAMDGVVFDPLHNEATRRSFMTS